MIIKKQAQSKGIVVALYSIQLHAPLLMQHSARPCCACSLACTKQYYTFQNKFFFTTAIGNIPLGRGNFPLRHLFLNSYVEVYRILRRKSCPLFFALVLCCGRTSNLHGKSLLLRHPHTDIECICCVVFHPYNTTGYIAIICLRYGRSSCGF